MMRAHRWFSFIVLAASLLARAAGAEPYEEKRFHLTPFIGWTRFDSERRFASGQDLTDDVYFGGRAGVRLAGPLWFELAGGYTGTEDCAAYVESWKHISGNLMLSPTWAGSVKPFLSLGGGAATFKNALGANEDAGNVEAAPTTMTA